MPNQTLVLVLVIAAVALVGLSMWKKTSQTAAVSTELSRECPNCGGVYLESYTTTDGTTGQGFIDNEGSGMVYVDSNNFDCQKSGGIHYGFADQSTDINPLVAPVCQSILDNANNGPGCYNLGYHGTNESGPFSGWSRCFKKAN